MQKPKMQVTNIYSGCSARWLKDGEASSGRKRYYHPDCEIYVVGRRTLDMDMAVMLALQDCHMPVIALRYNKGGK